MSERARNRERITQGAVTLYREHLYVSVCIHLWRGVTKNYLLSARAARRASRMTSHEPTAGNGEIQASSCGFSDFGELPSSLVRHGRRNGEEGSSSQYSD
jgi:hypothetical protein